MKNQLLEIKKKVIEYAFKLNELEYIDGVRECQSMIQYVYDTLNDENYKKLKTEKEKLALFCSVAKDAVIECRDMKSIYEVPLALEEQMGMAEESVGRKI